MYSGFGGGNSFGNSDSPSTFSPKSHSTLRREKDVYKLSSKYKINFINGTKEFLVNFRGPIGSPYDGGYWAIKIDMPDAYPFKSPSVGFINRIYHPNVDEASGSICLDVISHKWSPIFDLSHIFDHFLPQLLQEPNTGDPLNLVAAQHCFKDHAGFCQRVSEYIKKYATPEEIATIMCTLIPNPPPRETLIAQFAPINPQSSNIAGNKKRDSRLTDDPCLEITQDDGLNLSLNSSSASLSKYNSTTQDMENQDPDSSLSANRSQQNCMSLTSLSNITLNLDDPSNIFDLLAMNDTLRGNNNGDTELNKISNFDENNDSIDNMVESLTNEVKPAYSDQDNLIEMIENDEDNDVSSLSEYCSDDGNETVNDAQYSNVHDTDDPIRNKTTGQLNIINNQTSNLEHGNETISENIGNVENISDNSHNIHATNLSPTSSKFVKEDNQ